MTPGSYHLFSLGTFLLISYFVSLFLTRYHMVPLQAHRKFWNTLLLLFFISTASLGMLLVIKVNYKLNISWIDEAKQWHVDSGIGFFLVAIFHLLWHRRYYLNRSVKNANGTLSPPPDSVYSKREFRFIFILLGFITILAQLVMLREFLKNFSGNELVIALFLSSWMMLTALGASLGSRSTIRQNTIHSPLLLLLISVLPLLIYLLLLLISRFMFLPGVQPGLLNTIICIVLLIFPVCGLSGYIFGFVSREGYSKQDGSPYMLDALGSLAGGVLFAVLLVHFLNNLQVLALIFLTSCAGLAIVFNFPSGVASRRLLLLLASALFILSLVPGLQNKVEELRYRNEELLTSRDTPHGNLSFTYSRQQVSAYMDGIPLITSSDITKAEESVHYPSLQLHEVKSFLLLGGGLSGLIHEALKYKPDIIHYCEANPWVYRLGKLYFPEKTQLSYQFIQEDGRSWLMNDQDKAYDVIISDAGNPHNIGSNRFFTLEFFQEVRKSLSSNGVFCMHLTTADNYVNKEGLKMLGINMSTLKEVFPHVLLIRGQSTYFLASPLPLSLDIPGLLERSDVPTTYVHPDYLDAGHMQFESEQLTQSIQEQEEEINSDLWPRLFFASLLGIQAKSGKHSMIVAGILSLLVFLFLFIRYSPLKRAMYVTGFTGAGMQIILIMVMQSFYGFAYMVAPMMITLFMAGIVAGVISRKYIWKNSSLKALGLLVFIMGLISVSGTLISAIGTKLFLGFLNFTPGVLVGWVYSMGVASVKQGKPGISGSLFSADLTGAALGTLVSAIFLLPLIGSTNTFILFFCINLITGLLLWTKEHS